MPRNCELDTVGVRLRRFGAPPAPLLARTVTVRTNAINAVSLPTGTSLRLHPAGGAFRQAIPTGEDLRMSDSFLSTASLRRPGEWCTVG
jgi:hypothetical protein